MADYFLKELDAFNDVAERGKRFSISNESKEKELSSYRLLDYVKHIHHAKEEEIRERFTQPEMSEDEAADLIFKMSLEDELEKINPRETEFEIDL